MLRVVLAIVAIPSLLVVLLAAAMNLNNGELGGLSAEAFELGLLPLAIVFALVLLAIYMPILFLTSMFLRVSVASAVIVGLLSALLLVLIAAWPTLTDATLRWQFRVEHLLAGYPWFALGAIGGLMFWLLAVFRNGEFDQQFKRHS